MKPETFSLLRPGTPMRMASPEGGLPLLPDEGEKSAAHALAWLRKLPDSFRPQELLQFLTEAPPADTKEHPGKFLLQAMTLAIPREEETREGRPAQFYFFQNEWRGLQVTWEKGKDRQGQGAPGPKAPVKVRVETEARHMGKVDVGLAMDPKGARLDFHNQFHDVGELLAMSIPELERNLALLDFHVSSWTYGRMQDDAAPSAAPPPAPGPAPSDRSLLDLFG